MKYLHRTLVLVLLAFATMQAQDVTKGDITGKVKDPSGMVIPAATVKLSSPYGDKTTTTDGGGVYSFQNLVIGPGYSLEVDQPGFAPAIAKDMTVGVNQHTAYDFTLQIGTTATTVEVESTSNAIDLSTTTIGANIDQTLFQNVPVGRNISAIMAMAPGVADSAGAGAANPSINGASGLENEYIINGANTTDPGFGGFGTFSRVYGPLGNGIDFDFVQEVQVQTGGMEAQYGEALGGVVNVVTKAGTNDFHFDAFEYFQPQQFEATRTNANTVLTNKFTFLAHQASLDYGADGGGRILKDKVFWYGGINPLYNTSYKQADKTFANSVLGVVPVRTTVYDYTGKVDYNLGTKHQFEGSVFGDPSSTPYTYNQGLSTTKFLAANGTQNPVDTALETQETYGTRTWTARYNGTFTPNLGVTVNYSNYYNNFTDTPLHNGYEITDATPSQSGVPGASNNTYGGIGFNEASVAKVNQVTIATSHVFRFLGQHVLQYGYQFEDQVYDDVYQYSGTPFTLPNIPALGAAAGQVMFGATFTRTHENTKDPSSPIVLKLTRGNYSSPNIATDTRYHAGFIQDSWSLGRITIKPGLRFEQQGMSGIQSHYAFTHNWAPRIGVIVDPFNDRKTKIDMSWGRFFEKIPLDMAVRALTFETSITNAWYADPGAGNQPNLSASSYVPGGPIAFQGDPSALENVAPGTGSQFQDEVTAGAEHEFKNGITFTGRFVYRDLRRIIEDMSGINVTQALAGVPQIYVVGNPSAKLDIFQNAAACSTPGVGNCLSYPNPFGAGNIGFTAFKNGTTNPNGSDGLADGFPNPSRVYKSMELIFSKRLPFYNATFYGSYVLSKLDGNFQGSFRSDNGQQDPNISSLFDFTNSDGILTGQDVPGVLPSDRTHQLKLFGNFQWHSINVGLSFTPTSGTPITDLLDHPAYDNAGEIPVCATTPLPNSNTVTPASFNCAGGPRGAYGRTPWIFPFNAHLDYTWKLGEKLRVKAVADLFNLFNEQAVTRVNQFGEVSGAPGTLNVDFLKPALQSFADPYQNPFNARLAVRFEF